MTPLAENIPYADLYKVFISKDCEEYGGDGANPDTRRTIFADVEYCASIEEIKDRVLPAYGFPEIEDWEYYEENNQWSFNRLEDADGRPTEKGSYLCDYTIIIEPFMRGNL